MKSYFFRIKAFLSWWLEAVDEHSLHSPFFFDFYLRVVKPARTEKFASIENLRQQLRRDRRTIIVHDLGAKAKVDPERKIASVARTSLSSPRFSMLYNRIIRSTRASMIVELGTSFGINTLYLAEAPGTTVTTFEGAPAVADIAALTFQLAAQKNINLIPGDIEKTFPDYISQTNRIDFAFLDANHRYEPTVRYFEWLVMKLHDKSVVVVDDIHYSSEMARAWQTIKNHRLVYGSADLFRCGIVFFDPSLNKQHVILQL